MKKILSVDDHVITTIGLSQLAQRIPGGGTVSSACDGITALQRIRDEAWDLVLLDIVLKDRSGLDVLLEIKKIAPKLPVMIFTLHTGVAFIQRALKNGADGYLTKENSDEEILQAIITVIAGEKYVSQALRQTVIFATEDVPHNCLSAREFEVLIKIGEGKTVREIAMELYLSESTVETYRARIKNKMHFQRDAELIRYCVGAGLVSAMIPHTSEDSANTHS